LSDFRFQYIPYPLWRRQGPLRPLLKLLCRPFYPVEADSHPPATPRQMAAYLARWNLLGGLDTAEGRRLLEANPNPVDLSRADSDLPDEDEKPVRLPAQWEPLEAVILSWPVQYPPLWPLHAAITAAIAPVAEVVITVPRPSWASGIRLYRAQCGGIDLDQLRFVYLPTDDVWVRDYGPFVGLNGANKAVAVSAHYEPQLQYPHSADDAMPRRWATHQGIASRQIPLYIEGGNLLSDGAGTLIMSDRFERTGLHLDRSAMAAALHRVFKFDKLIVTPHLMEEPTGHVDLLVKLADAETVLITEAGDSINTERLAQAAETFRGERNARGIPYRVLELPFLPPYYNWAVYPIWRSYSNALTVNGRVLVPVYGEKADERAIAIYEDALPHYSIIPIDCRIAINGGGAVHCLTKEIPRA